jgi:hypothetical protein
LWREPLKSGPSRRPTNTAQLFGASIKASAGTAVQGSGRSIQFRDTRPMSDERILEHENVNHADDL